MGCYTDLTRRELAPIISNMSPLFHAPIRKSRFASSDVIDRICRFFYDPRSIRKKIAFFDYHRAPFSSFFFFFFFVFRTYNRSNILSPVSLGMLLPRVVLCRRILCQVVKFVVITLGWGGGEGLRRAHARYVVDPSKLEILAKNRERNAVTVRDPGCPLITFLTQLDAPRVAFISAYSPADSSSPGSPIIVPKTSRKRQDVKSVHRSYARVTYVYAIRRYEITSAVFQRTSSGLASRTCVRSAFRVSETLTVIRDASPMVRRGASLIDFDPTSRSTAQPSYR